MARDESACAAIDRYLAESRELLGRLPVGEIARVLEILAAARREGRVVFVCGNGGSASTASHVAVDLGKTLGGAGGSTIRAHALTDNVGLITAWANDAAYAEVFAAQLDPLVREGDVLFAISASGNSPNVLRAVELANGRGAATIGWTGFAGGKLAGLVQVSVVVPSDSMQHIEDVHLLVATLRDVVA